MFQWLAESCRVVEFGRYIFPVIINSTLMPPRSLKSIVFYINIVIASSIPKRLLYQESVKPSATH